MYILKKLNNGSMSSSKVKKCPGKESLERINYLYQASNELATKTESTNHASTMYSNLVVGVSKKAVQRLDVRIKRSICKGCRSLLLAGLNCRVRIKKKQATWTCLQCSTVKRFALNKNYELWQENNESVLEILDYKENK